MVHEILGQSNGAADQSNGIRSYKGETCPTRVATFAPLPTGAGSAHAVRYASHFGRRLTVCYFPKPQPFLVVVGAATKEDAAKII